MAQTNRLPQIIVGAVVLGGIAFFMTEPEETPTAERETRTRNTRTQSKGLEAFTEEDQNAVFARLQDPVSNVFKPLVARSGAAGSGANATNLLPNQVPPYMVNGETGWFYTGTAYIDDVPSVLLENTATGVGQYLRVGETMSNARVTKITPNTVVLTATNGGTSTTLTLIENRPVVDDFNISVTSNQPLDPLTGPIGLTANDQETTDIRSKVENQTSQATVLNDPATSTETQAHEAP